MPLKLLTDRQADRVGRIVRLGETMRPGATHDVGPSPRGSAETLPWTNVGSTTVPAYGVIRLGGQTQVPDPLRPGFQRQVIAGRSPDNLLGRFAANSGVDVAAGEIGYCHLRGPCRALYSSSSSNGCYGPTPNSHLMQPSISTGLPGFARVIEISDHAPGPYAWVTIRPILAAQVLVGAVGIAPGSTGSCTVGGYTIQGTNRTANTMAAGSGRRAIRLFDETTASAWDLIF